MGSGCQPSTTESSVGAVGRINQYGLVAYINGKLGDFLLQLRQEIVPGCNLRSHVSLLPPRPLAGTEPEAEAFIQASGRLHSAFEVGLDQVEVFRATKVIYVSIGAGLSNLHAIHDELNAGALLYAETFRYHPHITLAQELSEAANADALRLCQARWREYAGPRHFPVETLTFVRNTAECGNWQDLSEVRLEMAGSRR